MGFASSFSATAGGLRQLDARKREQEEYDRLNKERGRQQEQTEMYRRLSSDMSASGYPEPLKYKKLASQASAYGDLDKQKQFDDYRKALEAEGAAEALKYVRAGDLGKAAEYYNSIGEDRVSSLEFDPSDRDKNTLIYTTPEGEKGSIDLRYLEARTMSGIDALNAERAARTKGAERGHDINKIRVTGEEARKTEAAKQKPSSGISGTAGKVKLVNGQIVDESDLRSEYATRYGKYDPRGNLVVDEAAPTFDQYRNSMVTPEYRRSFDQGGQDEQIPLDKALSMATKEADERDPIGPNFMRPGGMKEAYGAGGREAWINNRAMEIAKQGLSNRGMGLPSVGGAQQSAPSQAAQTPVELPPQAVSALKEGVVTNFRNGQSWTLSNGKPVRVDNGQ